MSEQALSECVEKMRAAGVAEAAIEVFARHHRQVAAGQTGLLPETEIEPVEELPRADELPEPGDRARSALEAAVVIKLNGGLGTSMGMSRAKSLLEVKPGLSFLDVIARQTLELRRRHRVPLPLVLMNSFHTQEDTLAALERYPELAGDLSLDFLQSQEPKIDPDGLRPVSWPADPGQEWCPPGHGDLYPSLIASGTLAALLDRGYRYAFVSNSDNLGAVLDARILAWFAAEEIPFLMEAAERTPAHRKGGHLARTRDGRLVLREIAQVPDADMTSFQDVERHRYFNTNSLWLDLRALAAVLDAKEGVLGLDLIVNRKTVDPTDPGSPPVLQLETAMGSAVAVFDGARALLVGHDRFAPVKTTNELLALRSDCYEVTDDSRVVLAARRADGPPLIDLDPDHFRLLDDFEARFPAGPPSLVDCRSLAVRGDVSFGHDVVVRGAVEVTAGEQGRLAVPDRAVLEG